MYTALFISQASANRLEVVIEDFVDQNKAFTYMNEKYGEGYDIYLYDEVGDFVRVSRWLEQGFS